MPTIFYIPLLVSLTKPVNRYKLNLVMGIYTRNCQINLILVYINFPLQAAQTELYQQ